MSQEFREIFVLDASAASSRSTYLIFDRRKGAAPRRLNSLAATAPNAVIKTKVILAELA